MVQLTKLETLSQIAGFGPKTVQSYLSKEGSNYASSTDEQKTISTEFANYILRHKNLLLLNQLNCVVLAGMGITAIWNLKEFDAKPYFSTAVIVSISLVAILGLRKFYLERVSDAWDMLPSKKQVFL